MPGHDHPVCARFTARYPAVRVEAHLSTRPIDLVAEGFDLALRGSPKQPTDPKLTIRRLGAFEGRAYASPAYLARRGVPRSPRELDAHEWVVFRPMRGPIRFDGPGAPITVQPRGRIVADDFLFVREAAGAGVAVMASLFAAKDVAEGRLVSLFPRHLVNAGGLYLSYPTTRHLPRKVTAFRNMLVEVMEARSLDALGG